MIRLRISAPFEKIIEWDSSVLPGFILQRSTPPRKGSTSRNLKIKVRKFVRLTTTETP